MKKIITIILFLTALCACTAKKPLYYPPVIWMRDADRRPIDMPPIDEKAIKLEAIDSVTYRNMEKLLSHTSGVTAGYQAVVGGGRQEALNVNNFDEVADSTWFTNRLGRHMMSASEVIRPASRGLEPDTSAPLTVLAAKIQGRVPRMLVRDSTGRRYLIRFEHPGARGIGLGSEMISSLILDAAGYKVPHDHFVEFVPHQFILAKGAETRDEYGETRKMTEEDLKKLVDRITGGRRRRIKAVSSTFFHGKYIGPFKFSSRRYGDTNDRIPHQFRRELRGYRMFCALLNMVIPSPAQTADIFFTTEGEKGYVVHYIYDFGSSFGGAGSWLDIKKEAAQPERGKAVANLFSLGMADPGKPEPEIDKPDEFDFLDVRVFDPGRWKPMYMNEAFAQMTARDAYWAARIIMRFTDEDIDAIVDRAEFPERKTTRYVKKALKARRDAIGRYAFSRVNPLDYFKVSPAGGGATVNFDDLQIKYGFVEEEDTEYRYMLQTRFGKADLTPWRYTRERKAVLERKLIESMDPKRVYQLRIQVKKPQDVYWPPSIDVFLKREGRTLKIVGLERRRKL